jgi:LSD1 subclass zinc finger protein
MVPRLVQATCPHCGATLPIAPGATQVQCTYCHTTIFVQPPKHATGVYVAPPEGHPRVHLDVNQWTQLGGAVAKGAIGVTVAIFAFSGLAVVAGMIAVGFAVRSAPPSSKPRTEVDRGTTTTDTKKVTYDFGGLGSCECKVKVDGKEGFAQLSAVISGPDDDHLKGKYVLTAPGDRELELPVTDESSPPRKIKAGTMNIGIATICDQDIVAIVTGEVASGWSTKPTKIAKLVWSTRLPGKYVYPGAGKPKGGKFSIDCANGAGDVVGFSTEAGAVRIRVVDGKIMPPTK